MKRKMTAILSVLSLWPLAVQAEEIPVTEENWEISEEWAGISLYQAEPVLSLYFATAWLKDSAFENGTVEFKVMFPKDRGFVGIKFRAQDEDTYEHFYMRPHQSGNDDANQYTPVFHGNTGWQIYYGPQYSVPVTYPYGEWIDVKLVISGQEMDVYINSEEPVLHVDDLKLDAGPGRIGLDAFGTQAMFRDIRITPQAAPALIGKGVPAPSLPANLVTDWAVAGPMSVIDPQGDSALAEAMAVADWQVLQSGDKGIANLGRLGPVTEGRDLILARLRVRADRAMLRRLDFGYSDTVTAFVNGTPVYAGDNSFTSRDYRYLGTVGLFDSLLLPLQEGENEIVFAVQEAFGGWAVMAAFENMDGLEILPAR